MLKPLHDYVLLEIKEDENKTAAGIIIPDNAKNKVIKTAVVKAVGPGKQGETIIKFGEESCAVIKPLLKVDDVVVFSEHAISAHQVSIKELPMKYVLIKESDILAKI